MDLIRARPWGLALLFAAAGGTLVLGGAIHPDVPPEPDVQMRVIAGSDAWVPVHWALSLAQASAAGGVAAALGAWRAPVARTTWFLGGGAIVLGLVFGTFGTLSGATAVAVAATGAGPTEYTAMADWSGGVGWLCVVLTGAGAAVLGVGLLRVPGWAARLLSGLVALAGAGFAAGALALGPQHASMHGVVLPIGAMTAGVGLVALALAALLRPPAAAA